MSREEAIEILKNAAWLGTDKDREQTETAVEMAISALEQEPVMQTGKGGSEYVFNPAEPCDTISRRAVVELIEGWWLGHTKEDDMSTEVQKLPSVQPSRKGHCKDCKYFEYDSVANVDGVPLIVAHEICSKWGDGCKTREDGYCFLFESADMRGDTDADSD